MEGGCWSRAALGDGPGGRPRPPGDDVGEDRQGDLLRRTRPDVQSGGSHDANLEIVGDVEAADDRRTALGAGHEADVVDLGAQRGFEHDRFVAAVRGDDDGAGIGQGLGAQQL